MEKHRCKLCLRKFANGRALGGHMRSHMMAQKKEEQRKAKDDQQQQLRSEEFELVQSFSSSSSEEENKEGSKKKSKGFADPVCCFAVEAGCVVVQDRESETESSKNKNCGRPKRVRTSRISNTLQWWIDQKKLHKCAKIGKPDESEPVSSISDTTPEEDVAYSLMMLSRDKWMKEEKDEDYGDDEGEDRAEEQEEEGGKKCVDDDHGEDVCVVKVTKAGCRGKYRCETCNKVFRSYQALGGHRASHKKVKFNDYIANQEASEMVMETENAGGHKRSYFAGVATTSVNVDKPFSRMIDLNLPAPLDDDDDGDEISQMEVSAVSDAECANPIWD